MTDRNELVDEVRGGWLDTDTLDRMLAGGVHPDDAPPGYSEVARALLALAEPRDGGDLVHEAEHVALATELVKQRSPVPRSLDRRSRRASTCMWSRSHRGKIGALVVLGAMVGSTGLAVADVLPDAAQDAFAHVLEKVGITVPPGSGHPASSGQEVSGIATTTDAAGVQKGAAISSVASGGRGRAGQQASAVAAGGGHGAPPAQGPHGAGGGTADAARKGTRGSRMSSGHGAREGGSRAGSGTAAITPPGPPGASTPPGQDH